MVISRKAKFWREAASLILAVKCPELKVSPTPSVTSNNIVALPHHMDYKVLMLRRSSKSSFFASRYVFPGGVVSDADFSDEWDSVFKDVSGRTLSNLAQEFKVEGPRPPILQDNAHAVSSDIAFRICAIRETFEESGILLVKDKESVPKPGSLQVNKGSVLHSTELERWRLEVDKEPFNFIRLCQQLNVVPDIWSLKEWSNWLTPVHKKVDVPPKKPQRFDTLFYTCCLEKEGIPQVQTDERETFEPEWLSPADFLEATEGFGSGKLKLAGPQPFELGRLCRLTKLEQLCQFCHHREALGLERWMSVYYQCTNGNLTLISGDDEYPDDPDYEGVTGVWPQTVDKTCQEMCHPVKRMHRSIHREADNYQLVCNTTLKYGQLSAIQSLHLTKPGYL